MKKFNHLEEIMALRPIGEASEDINTSITAIEAKARDYALQAEVLRQKRKASLLLVNADDLLGFDRDVGSLEIAVEQAREVVAQLKVKAAERIREEYIEALQKGVMGRQSLVEKQSDFATRFQTFYAKITAEYMALKAERDLLIGEAQSFNHRIDICAKETATAPDEIVARVPKVEMNVVSVAYFDRVCLPEVGLDSTQTYWVKMLHKGDFWLTGIEAGMNPEAVKELQRARAAIAANDRADELLRNPIGGGYVSKNLGTHFR